MVTSAAQTRAATRITYFRAASLLKSILLATVLDFS
jgi:hypothetical protein